MMKIVVSYIVVIACRFSSRLCWDWSKLCNSELL